MKQYKVICINNAWNRSCPNGEFEAYYSELEPAQHFAKQLNDFTRGNCGPHIVRYREVGEWG